MKRLPFARYVCCLLLVLFPLMARATGQIADDVVIDGEVWRLLASPLSDNDSICNRIDKILPKEKNWSTGNWDGFVGSWEVVDSCLYLKEVIVAMWDEHKRESYELVFDADTLKTVLKEYHTEHGILAGWFSREKLIIGRGELVTYVHGGYLRNHEEELVTTIKNGRIIHQEHWRNRKVMEGWSLSEAGLSKTCIEIINQFPFDLFPELDTVRVIVHVRNVSLTPDGHFEDCDIFFTWMNTKQREEDPNHPIIVALKETMRKMYPWEVVCLHGKYTVCAPTGGRGVAFTLLLDKKRRQKAQEG
ncbi:MAG: hypothetical protein IJC77_06615 [Bacteroidaceae bacterium]|nr:hypothetical protein [Bacteroidaceae bacterium]